MVEHPIHSCSMELSASNIVLLREDLIVKKINELQKITSSLSVCLTGSTHKKDIVDKNVGMVQIHRSGL